MDATPEEIEKYLKLLAETPHRLASISQGINNTRLHFSPDEKAWSANDILAHLRSCADVWGKSIQDMLARDNPTLPYVHPRQWVRKTNYLELDFHSSFQAFSAQRKELLNLLKDLTFAGWSRTAMIKGREHTVFSQTRRMALHENEHCEQLASILKPG
jgi:hypothetical protein